MTDLLPSPRNAIFSKMFAVSTILVQQLNWNHKNQKILLV